MRPWTPLEDAAILQYRTQAACERALAGMGRSRSAIQKRRHQLGVALGPRGRPAAERDLSLLARHSDSELARVWGISRQRVHQLRGVVEGNPKKAVDSRRWWW